jgi:hypothetical protein
MLNLELAHLRGNRKRRPFVSKERVKVALTSAEPSEFMLATNTESVTG